MNYNSINLTEGSEYKNGVYFYQVNYDNQIDFKKTDND